MHQNVRSITGKTNLLDIVLTQHQPDIIVCTEIWCKKSEIRRVVLCGYELASAYCRPRRLHGGVAVFARDGVRYRIRNDLQSLAVEYQCELSAIELTKSKIIVIGLYRTGLCDFNLFLNAFELLIIKISDENKRFLIVGDANVDYLTDN